MARDSDFAEAIAENSQLRSQLAAATQRARDLERALRNLLGQCVESYGRAFAIDSSCICTICERVSPNATEHDEDCEAAAARAALTPSAGMAGDGGEHG